MARHGAVRIGISGWAYESWRGAFYPEGLPRRAELSYAAERFQSIEINGSFYALQRPESYAAWRDAAPEDFIFAVKGPRYITHMKRLKESETPLANFFGSGVLRLGPKLGPILWQLPPRFRFDEERLSQFFALLPRTTDEALRLARHHNDKIKGRSWLQPPPTRPLRHALEIRDDSFKDPDFIRLLRHHDIALVCADTVEWPLLMDLTSDFVYCRLHGSKVLYASGYDDEALERWAGRVTVWAQGGEPDDANRVLPPLKRRKPRDVFVFFDNDARGRAPFDALSLQKKLAKRLKEKITA